MFKAVFLQKNEQGEFKASRINPAALWSSIAPAALDGTFSARAVNAESANPAIDLSAVVKPSGTQPKAGQLAGLRLRDLNLQGRWTPQPDNAALGVLDLRTLSAGLADATLDGQGRLDVGARSFDGRLSLKLPGAQGDWQGRAAHAQGKGEQEQDAGPLRKGVHGFRGQEGKVGRGASRAAAEG